MERTFAQEAHDELLREWSARPHHADRGFCSDGPVDPARWSTTSCRGRRDLLRIRIAEVAALAKLRAS
jgi:hypothetical protein